MTLTAWLFGLFALALLFKHLFFWRPLDTSVIYRQHPFLRFGHRGAAALAPENTLVGFRKAIADGCNAVELDVHITRDGRLVVFHDDRLERTTDGKGRLADYKYGDLAQLNAAVNWDTSYQAIPTLEEVINALPSDIIINMELKNFSFFSDMRLEREVVMFIHRHGLRDRVIVSSFNPLNIWRVKMADPTIFTALLWHRRGRFSLRVPLGFHLTHPDFLHPYYTNVQGRALYWSRTKGIPIHVWVVNDAEKIRELKRLPGVRGIMSDDTELLNKVLTTRESMA